LFRPLQALYADSMGICFDRPWHPVDVVGDLVRYRLGWTRTRSDRAGRLEARIARPLIARALPRGLRDTPLAFVDHHLAHAESAWRTAGAGDWLVLTADAHGDGRSLTAWLGRDGADALEPLLDVGVDASLGAFYSYVTKTLGFRPGRHEGKVMALAASGDAARIPAAFPFRWDGDRLRFTGSWGLQGSRRLRVFKKHAREDVAAWVQTGTERILLELVDRLLEATGARQVALAGGVFANVVVNGLIATRPQVERLHVFPHMGDGGLAAGAALHVAGYAPASLTDATLGPDLDPEAVRRAVGRSGLVLDEAEDPDAVLADALAFGQPVVRCVGRLELGPRALGHRSVLAPAADPELPERLNAALQRDTFMPFAPVVRAEDAPAAFPELAAAGPAARFMTVALPAAPAFAELCPAAVHVDGTARPQVVHPDVSPGLHQLLTRYAEFAKRPGVINTSFNLHEEPIVHAPRDAIRAFEVSGLPLMRLGPWLLRNPESPW
nr:carbamoyltransferase C-terminal domain-containing protein [Planctomycetota bacterium]